LFDSPHGIAVDGDGNVFVADFMNHRIRQVTPNVAGVGSIGATLDLREVEIMGAGDVFNAVDDHLFAAVHFITHPVAHFTCSIKME